MLSGFFQLGEAILFLANILQKMSLTHHVEFSVFSIINAFGVLEERITLTLKHPPKYIQIFAQRTIVGLSLLLAGDGDLSLILLGLLRGRPLGAPARASREQWRTVGLGSQHVSSGLIGSV